MFEDDVATLNGHLGSSVFAPTESATEMSAWPIREDLWAQPTEGPETNEVGGLETFEDTWPGPSTPHLGRLEEGEEDSGEYLTGYAGEDSMEQTWPANTAKAPPFGQLPSEQGVLQESTVGTPTFEDTESEEVSLESVHGAGEPAYEDTAQVETYEGSGYEDGSVQESDPEAGYEQTGYEQTGYEQTGYEQTGYEQTGYEQPGYEQAGYEQAGYEQAGYEQAGYEQAGYEQAGYEQAGYEQTGYEQTGYEQAGYETVSLEDGAAESSESSLGYATETGELNPELVRWPGEVLAEDWVTSGGTPEPRLEIAELLHEERKEQVAAGERIVTSHPLLRVHRGTQPDLVVRWNAMPRSTTLVDVVVHLHGYSAAGPRMRVSDKAGMSGVELPSSGPGGGGPRPMLGLVPRGNYFGGQSGAGYNFPQLVQPGALNQLVASGLDLLASQTGVRARAGRLILTGHSGGGAPLNAILRHTDADEVHIFDGSYGDMSNVIAWAKRRITRGSATSALRVLFRPGSGTAKHALAIAAAICPTIDASSTRAAAMHRRFRVEATSIEHNLIPKTYGPLLLADPGADLPGTVRRGCVHANPPSSRSRGGAPGVQVASSPPLTRTPDRLAGVVKVTPWTKDGTRALPGAVALAAQWRRLTGRVAGTFNPRNTSFGTRSLHSEGRAIDCHGHVSNPQEAAQAEAYIRWLLANAVELQVATVIWNRRIWSWPRRHQGWRNYMTKPNHNPHTDHFHVDLSWEGALHPSPLFSGGVPGLGGATAPPQRRTPPSAPSRRPPSRPAPAGSSQPPGSAPASGVRRSPAEFVRMFGPFAKASEAKTGVPGLVTLAQAAVESGWGARAAGNNFFGIKARASDAPGTRQLWRTREVLSRPDVRSFPEVISVTPRPDGRYDYVVRDWFRVFPSPELAFVGHGEFLQRNKRYAPAFAFGNDPYRFAAEVAKAGYATDPGYTKVVHSVMRLLERNGWK